MPTALLCVALKYQKVVIGNKLVGMVVVAQRDALLFQQRLIAVDLLDELVDLALAAQVVAGDDDVRVADGLVVLHRALKVRVQLSEAGMRSGDLQTILVQPALDLLSAVAEKARELHIRIAHLRDGLHRAFQIRLRNVAHRIHLKSVFHNQFPL